MNKIVGRYKLNQKLALGATSEVWQASYEEHKEEHKCALKLLKYTEIPTKNIRLFNNEVKVLSNLNHPHIITLYEAGDSETLKEEGGKENVVMYLATELAAKGDLFDYVSRTGVFSEPLARHYFKVIVNTLDYIHKQGYSYRNLKLENLLVTSDYQLKLSDFGLATLSEVFEFGVMTCSYYAPEVYAKTLYSGIEADLFSLGVLLFTMVAGHSPFAKARLHDKWFKMLCSCNNKFWMNVEMRRKGNKFTEEFKDIINNLLSFKPELRLTINQIKAHPWYNEQELPYEKIREDMEERYAKLERH